MINICLVRVYVIYTRAIAKCNYTYFILVVTILIILLYLEFESHLKVHDLLKFTDHSDTYISWLHILGDLNIALNVEA